ncbi:MAG: type II toxin-antitoxin system RelE/ParE family toxin [Flavobacterium sp.]|jgi:plasmid stabilization system protein ParE|uniref:type II toxin-antitoxin system RelE/ParE family toxin n=2 Tax=Flavobacterium sp. TaxID=239 RepID=UPI002B48FE04|nr:type II toxin-antitoxin system RelE/ParE family toxin [Flavobacterium sp.]WRH73101.1 MAG: type II toxin-antitoxin system RelE/ParE family toxin [Flavobacterium sp.]
MYSIHWSKLAEITFSEEMDFIFEKWNQKEVDKFGLLVQNCLQSISENPKIGKNESENQVYSFVISKQTTIYFKISEIELRIDLILFWNNKKNPILLDKYLNY